LAPTDASAHNGMGNSFAQQNDFASAIPYYREAIRLDPDFTTARVNLGLALMRTGDTSGARDQFQRALDADPANQSARQALEILPFAGASAPSASPEELHQKALARAARGDYEGAAGLFQKILDIVPAEPGTLYNLACMYAQMGRTEEAMAWLSRAMAHGYDNWDAIENDPDLDNIRESASFKALIKNRP
jgi:Flp pilus assembly protein TadD